MKRFVFSIDSKELVINADNILEAVEEIKDVMKIIGNEPKIRFIGIKY